jgi:hypothetical protein
MLITNWVQIYRPFLSSKLGWFTSCDDVFCVDFFLPTSVKILFFVTFVKLTERGVFYCTKIREIMVHVEIDDIMLISRLLLDNRY